MGMGGHLLMQRKMEPMMVDSRPSRTPVVAAAVGAGLLLLAYGLTYRVLAARLAAPVNRAPIDPAAVQQFPMQIGDWMGEEVPIPEDVVRATDTDAHISRRYLRPGFGAVSLYVACGVRARDLMPHRPEVCYTGAGWTVVSRNSPDLSLADGMRLPCSVLQFSRGALTAEKVVVLYYYLVDGQHCADVSLLRSKAWRGSGAVNYVAQVQVITPIAAVVTAEEANRVVHAFAVESAPWIARLFEDDAVSESTDGTPGSAPETAGGLQP